VSRLLSWLGLQREDAYPNLDALMRELRRALPEDENVLLRYIAVVVVLLGKVAWADGSFTRQEEEALRGLLTHIERLAPSGVEAVCTALRGKLPSFSEEEMALCFREMKALCDGRERAEVMRLLTRLAVADGATSVAERTELFAIGEELGVPESELAAIEKELSGGGGPSSG
jgi:uncharacterized tellurite resistance protein B-like protein